MPKSFETRIQSKHDTTANWNAAQGFIPLAGEIIIYDDYEQVDGQNIPGIKIGTGNAYVQDLPFIVDAVEPGSTLDLLDNVINETLVFTRD